MVEDDPGVRQFVVECLELSGHRVTQAEHGEAGLAQIDSAEPDLMMVDCLMPGTEWRAARRRGRIKRPDLPIIIATGYADMQEIRRSERGAEEAVPDAGPAGEYVRVALTR